jgi:hypothetical protein
VIALKSLTTATKYIKQKQIGRSWILLLSSLSRRSDAAGRQRQAEQPAITCQNYEFRYERKSSHFCAIFV